MDKLTTPFSEISISNSSGDTSSDSPKVTFVHTSSDKPISRVSGIYQCEGYSVFPLEDLPEEPPSLPYAHDRVDQLRHILFCQEIARLHDNLGEKRFRSDLDQYDDARHFESLPLKRELAIIYEDLPDELEQHVYAKFRSVLFSAHCKSKSIALRIGAVASEVGVHTQSGRLVHAERRSQREEAQREAARKKLEELRRSVPKEVREKERKLGRELREMLKIELQGVRDLALGAALAGIGALGFRVLKKTSNVLDNVSVLLDGIKTVGRQLRNVLKHLWYVPLVLVLKYFIGEWRNSFLTAALVAFMPKFFGVDLWSHISDFFPTGDIETQSNFDVFSKLLSVAFTFSVFKGRINASKITEFCKRLSSLDRMSKGWESFLTWTMSALEALVNFARQRFGKEKLVLYKRSDEIAEQWAREAEAVLSKDAVGGEIDPASLDNIIALLQRGYGLKELYRSTEVGKLVDVLVARLGAVIAPHLGSVSARNNFRFEPVAAFLYGKPGVGKTLMAVPFVTAILLMSGLVETPCTPDDVTREMWQKGTSEYWQGYDRQKAIIMDDAFQNRAFQGDKDNDYFNMIKMCGSFSMPLNFADLASKGKIFFASKFIFGSTNLSSIASESRIVIQEPEAVARRINYGYELFVHDEWQLDGKLDYARFRREWDKCVSELTPGADPLTAFPWYIWYVREHDFIRGSTNGESVPLAQAIVSICDNLRLRMSTHETTRSNLNAMITAFSVETQSGRSLMDFHQQALGCIWKKIRLAGLAGRKELIEDSNCVQRLLKVAVFAAGTFVAFKLTEAVLCGLCKLFSGVKGAPVLNSNRPLTRALPVKHDVRLQSGNTRTVVDNIYANTYKMYVKGNRRVIGQVLFLTGELAVQPQHYTEHFQRMLSDGEMDGSDILILRNSMNEQHVIQLTLDQYMSFKRLTDRDNDVEFIKFGSVRAHRAILHSLVTESDLRFVSGNPVHLNICEIDDRVKVLDVSTRRIWRMPGVKIGARLPTFGADRRMDRYFKYPCTTTPGDCGAPLTLEDSRMFGGRCLLGIHCAADLSNNYGFSNVLTRERVNEAVSFFGIVEDRFEEDLKSRGVELQNGDEMPFENMGSFLPIGTVSKPVTICPRSKFYKTHLYDSLGVYEQYPAILAPIRKQGLIVWPMCNAVKPYSSPLLELDLPALDDAVHTAFKPFVETTWDITRDCYTFEEAIIGIPQEKFRSIPRNTAAGFPYVYDVTGGKRDFFGADGDYDLSTPMSIALRARVDHVLSEARQGRRLSHVFVDFLKDELRPIAKIESVSTRLISSAPLDYVVAWRMLFGRFSSAMMRKNVYTGMAPGICCYSDWPRIAEHLSKHGKHVFDGDFKAFDSSEQPSVHNAILEHINHWYNDSEENQLARRVLWMDLIHSRHIGGRGDNQCHIYQWNHSLPSGHPFTTIVNSLYSLVALIYCYFELTGDRRNFWLHVAPLTYGDDNVCNVDDEKIGVFNQVTVSSSMERNFGMVYTSGRKDEGLKPFSSLDNVTFLKREFFDDNGRSLCPLDLSSFLFTHYWCKNKKMESEILISVLENALEELSLHPSSVWDEHAHSIAKLLREEFGRETNVSLKRQSYQSLVLSRTDDWY